MFGVRSDEFVNELEHHLVRGLPRRGSDVARWLARLSEFDKAQGWFGFRSCAHWLAARHSMTRREARTYVRVARQLEELPRVERALFAGRLSYAKVAMVCRVATADSEKHVLRVALSLRDDDFALVIAEVEATRRRQAVVDFDPTRDETNARAESARDRRVVTVRAHWPSAPAPPRARCGPRPAQRGPPAMARSLRLDLWAVFTPLARVGAFRRPEIGHPRATRRSSRRQ